MARQERPIDPTEGPLQSLAYDLRKLRVEGGNPPYRTMARKTGYSASTLSQAASGTRRPTLDVLLAYVGALGGDQDAWRQRWQALDDAAGTAPAVEVPGAGEPPGTEPPAMTGSEPPPGRPTGEADRPRVASRIPGAFGTAQSWVTGGVALAASLVLVVIAVAATAQTRHGGSEPATGSTVAATPPGCPAVPKTATFTAKTYGSGAKVRQGPARLEQEIYTVPADCTIGLTGFCLGERIIDATAGTPDVRWFMVAGGGVVASAVVHGNPPAGMAVSRCPGDRAAPSAITLQVTTDPRDPGQVVLNATGSGVDIVGYAAYYARPGDAHGVASWHQIGLTGPGDDGFAMRWRIDRLPAGAKPIVAAAACLGGEAPTQVVDLDTLPAGGTTGPAAGHQSAAAATACLYPVAK